MIKIQAEIKESKFYYSYSVGKDEKHNMEADLDSVKLVAFLDLLKVLQRSAWADDDRFKEEITAKCWIEKNPDKAKLL